MIHLALTIASALFLGWLGIWVFVFGLAVIAASWRYVLGGAALLAVIGGIAYFSPAAAPVSKVVAAEPIALIEPDAYGALRTSVATAVSASQNNAAPPIPTFPDTESRLQYLRWLESTSRRLSSKIPDWPTRKDLLQTAWYESRRAGLEPSLVLAMIATTSDYRRFYVSDTGARGYMGISPAWARTIGDGDPGRLFHLQANLRFGTVVMRHYLDSHGGNVNESLRQYASENFGMPAIGPKADAFIDQVLATQRGLMYRS